VCGDLAWVDISMVLRTSWLYSPRIRSGGIKSKLSGVNVIWGPATLVISEFSQKVSEATIDPWSKMGFHRQRSIFIYLFIFTSIFCLLKKCKFLKMQMIKNNFFVIVHITEITVIILCGISWVCVCVSVCVCVCVCVCTVIPWYSQGLVLGPLQMPSSAGAQIPCIK
jgi:hypothetical protein